MDTLSERIETLEMENENLKKELRATRSYVSNNQVTS